MIEPEFEIPTHIAGRWCIVSGNRHCEFIGLALSDIRTKSDRAMAGKTILGPAVRPTDCIVAAANSMHVVEMHGVNRRKTGDL